MVSYMGSDGVGFTDEERARFAADVEADNVKQREARAVEREKNASIVGFSGKTSVSSIFSGKGKAIVAQAEKDHFNRIKREKDQCISYDNGHKVERAVYRRKYYIKNKDKILKAKEKYRETHAEEIKISQKEYRDKNKDAIKKRNKIYREKRKQEVLELRVKLVSDNEQ